MTTNPTKTNKPDATPPATEFNEEGTTALNAITESNPMPEIAETATTTKKRKANRAWLARKLDWIKQQKSILTELMNGKCCICHSTEKLEFDHPYGRGGAWDCRRPARWVRIKLYWLDFRAGNLRLLCGSCNRSYRYKGVNNDGSTHYTANGHFANADAAVDPEGSACCAEGS